MAAFTSPFLSTPVRLMRVRKRNVGGSSGYLGPVSIFRLYIRFSKTVYKANRTVRGRLNSFDSSFESKVLLTLGGPMIMPFHLLMVMSFSLSRPQETVPSELPPFWPSSNSSRSLKLRGMTARPMRERESE